MRKYMFFIFTLVLIGLFVLLIEVSKAESRKPMIILKFASLAPDGVGWAINFRENMQKGVTRVTDGDVFIDPYLGGVMGDDEDYIAKMRIDQLHGAGLSASGTVMACPQIAVLELPFLLNNFDEVEYIRTKMRQRLNRLFEKNGYRLWVLADQDFDQIYSTKNAIKTIEDFSKSRFVTWVGLVEQETLKALGTSPIPLDVPEIPSSIRSKMCNAMFAPAIWYVGTQLYTVAKYVTPCKVRYSPGCIIATMKAWNRIPEKYHEPIEEVMEISGKALNEYGHDSNKKCLKAMIKYGLKEVKLTPNEIEVLKKKTRPVWDKLAGKEYSRELLDEISGYLAEYRSKEKEGN
ncbi:MAG: TRAP transporter substrate-binding protein DctP [Thermodesulfobacteriota bacterium]|nr:TRAP transporter substrate-binding protein DctP [Thermodesulfobacteriota bacterium]